MIELILDKKSIQIDETLLNVKKHLEKFYSNKEQETIAQTLIAECKKAFRKVLLKQRTRDNRSNFRE
ncbi:hypothetical protein KH0195_15440 [Helicobacter pylori]